MRSFRPTDIPVFPHICRACVLIRPPGLFFFAYPRPGPVPSASLQGTAARVIPARQRRLRPSPLFSDIFLWTSAAESPHGIRAGSPGRENAAPQPGRKPQGAFPRLPFCPPGAENGCGATPPDAGPVPCPSAAKSLQCGNRRHPPGVSVRFPLFCNLCRPTKQVIPHRLNLRAPCGIFGPRFSGRRNASPPLCGKQGEANFGRPTKLTFSGGTKK